MSEQIMELDLREDESFIISFDITDGKETFRIHTESAVITLNRVQMERLGYIYISPKEE